MILLVPTNHETMQAFADCHFLAFTLQQSPLELTLLQSYDNHTSKFLPVGHGATTNFDHQRFIQIAPQAWNFRLPMARSRLHRIQVREKKLSVQHFSRSFHSYKTISFRIGTSIILLDFIILCS